MIKRKPTKKSAPRARKYKTADGDYLVIDESTGDYRIAWYIKEWESTGGTLGENGSPKAIAPADKSDWESWQAERTVAPLADGRDRQGYHFESERQARVALNAANEALFSGEAPWPAWATQAKAAGWTPPKGWKP